MRYNLLKINPQPFRHEKMSDRATKRPALAVRLPNWVGDAVMATPALRSLRHGFPGALICVVGKPGILKVLDHLPYFDESIPVTGRGLKRDLALAVTLGRRKFDLGVILPNSFSSALAFFLGGVKRRIGYALNGRTFMLNRSIRPVMEGLKRKPAPMTRYYLDLALFSGGGETDEKVELRTDPALDRLADRFMEAHELTGSAPLVGLNPGSSFGPSKLWTPEGFASVADRVHEELGGKSILLCGPGEEEIAAAILEKAACPIVDTSREVLSLDRLKSVMARLNALVTTDTGPRHFAAAFGIPTVVVMGPTDPRFTASNLENTRSIRLDVPCGPCHKKACDTDHRCMKEITGSRVFDALQSLLAARAAERLKE